MTNLISAIAAPPAQPNKPAQETSKQAGDEFDPNMWRKLLKDRHRAWAAHPVERRIRQQYLQEQGLNEADLANLSPEKRALHEKRIARETLQLARITSPQSQHTGNAVSTSLQAERGLADLIFEVQEQANTGSKPSTSKAFPQAGNVEKPAF